MPPLTTSPSRSTVVKTMLLLNVFKEIESQKRVVAMAGTNWVNIMRKVCGVLALSVVLLGSFVSQAYASDVASTFKDESGWKLQVNGNDYYIKGVVWGYSPKGENYSYNLWGESEDFIRK